MFSQLKRHSLDLVLIAVGSKLLRKGEQRPTRTGSPLRIAWRALRHALEELLDRRFSDLTYAPSVIFFRLAAASNALRAR